MTTTNSLHNSRSRGSIVLAGALAIAVVASPSFAQDEASTVVGGTAQWGISAYLNSPNFGRPNPLPEGYVEPAAFDEETRITSWGEATGTVNADGSAALAFAGSSVNFTSTSGAWIQIAKIEIELDAEGNGVLTAEVSYGMADGEFTADTAPQQGPARVALVDLAGNSGPDSADGTISWEGLTGTWSDVFVEFLAAGPWAYASTVNNDADDRLPAPLSITVEVE